jgi:hypothetical protein
MVNKILLFSIYFFLLTSCFNRPKCNLEQPYYKKGMFFLEHAKKFEKENNLYLAGYGINLNTTIETPVWNEIHQFEVTYCFIAKFNIEQARKKLLDSVQKYLTLINENQDLKPFLYKHPFTNKELLFRIDFYNEKRGYVGKDYISSCFLDGDKINYIFEPEENSPKYLHTETYEEALKIVQGNNL